MRSEIRSTGHGPAAPGVAGALAVLAASLLVATPAAATATSRGGGLPLPVSPGSKESVTAAPGACPTFSWSGVPGAPGYELAVVRLGETPEAPVLRAEVPGGASSWTPAADRCLAPGSYGWTLRVTGDPPGAWAPGLAFEVSAAPSAEEVARAIEVLESYRERTGGAARPGGSEAAAASGAAAGSAPGGRSAPAVPLGTSSAAILGDQTATSGAAYGVEGRTASPAGVGVSAANTAGGADLRLDGSSDGEADLLLRQSRLDRPSAVSQGFLMTNSGGGGFQLDVAGSVNATAFAGDGSALTGVPPAPHTHSGADITSGTVADARIASSLTRDAEVFGIVTAQDGAGSGLDADLLDGMDSSAFLPAGTDNWVDITGDAMTGDLSTTGDYLWDSPRTFYLSIPGSQFVPSNNSDAALLGKLWQRLTGSIWVTTCSFPCSVNFEAPLHLPQGAVLQSATVYAYDDDPATDATFIVNPVRRDLSSTSGEGIFAGGGGIFLTTTGASTSMQTASSTPVPGREVVDNQTYAYDIDLNLSFPAAGSLNLRFFGAQIAYTLPGPAN